MDNSKNDFYYLNVMLRDMQFVIDHVKTLSYRQFAADETLCDSVCFRFIQISESAKKISSSFVSRHPELPWTQLAGLRNKIVHDYGHVDLSIIYYTATKDLNTLKTSIEKIKE